MPELLNSANASVNASAHYRIDNGTFFQFPSPVVTQSSMDQRYNLESLKSGDLSPGLHRLFIEYPGVDNFVNGSVPLVLLRILTTLSESFRTKPFRLSLQPMPNFQQGRSPLIGSLLGLAPIIFGLIRTVNPTLVETQPAVGYIQDEINQPNF